MSEKNNRSEAFDKEISKDLDRSENEGYSVMYKPQKNKQTNFIKQETSKKEETMKVKDIMTRDPYCCISGTTLQFVARMMLDCDCGEIPVVNNEVELKPIGVITDRDIVCRAVAQGKNPLDMTAGECMTQPCITVKPETIIEECCKILEEKKIRRIPVVDEKGCCCGIVSQADIATHHLTNQIAEILEEVSQSKK